MNDQPGARPSSGAAFDHIEQSAAGYIDDLGGPAPAGGIGRPGQNSASSNFECAHRADPRRVVIDQGLDVGDHGVVDGVPRAARLAGQF